MGLGELIRSGNLWQRNTADLVDVLDGRTASLASGIYTPTLTNIANISASTASPCIYSRVGSVVTVSGFVTLDPVVADVATQLGMSLPVASDIGTSTDCAGVGFAYTVAGWGGVVYGDAANNRAMLESVAGSTANTTFLFTYQYRVL